MSASCLLAQEMTIVQLTGKVYRPMDTLMLLKAHEDFRYQGKEILIKPDSTFEYQLTTEYIEEYKLIFKSEPLTGTWRPIRFFSDGELISFELYPKHDGDKNIIEGSFLTKAKEKYIQLKATKFYDEMNLWYEKLYEPDQDSLVKITAQNKIDSLVRAEFFWTQDYFSKKPNLLGFSEYFHVLQNSERRKLTEEDLEEFHTFWLNEYPEHPLSELSENLMNSKRHIKVSGNFIDFQLAKEKTRVIRLSDVIPQSEYTILDLWAPWCGPCIRKSQKLKENYERLVERNIKVIGVVGGIDNYSKFEHAKTKFPYPWKLYPEVNNEKRIWEMYGVSRGGGGQFLIDKKGEILAVNPDIKHLLSITEK